MKIILIVLQLQDKDNSSLYIKKDTQKEWQKNNALYLVSQVRNFFPIC